jgi:hypothetical protein
MALGKDGEEQGETEHQSHRGASLDVRSAAVDPEAAAEQGAEVGQVRDLDLGLGPGSVRERPKKKRRKISVGGAWGHRDPEDSPEEAAGCPRPRPSPERTLQRPCTGPRSHRLRYPQLRHHPIQPPR